MNSKKAIVIGSGVAGMATAIRLAVQGFKVEVYEKNSYPGGKLHAFEKDGFHFDAGPSLFTQPKNIEELFELANEPIGQYFTYQPIDIACKYFYENGKVVTAFTNRNDFTAELQKQLKENPSAINAYLNTSAKVYDNIGTIFLNYSLHKAKTWLHTRIFKALRTVKFGHLFTSLNQYNNKYFTSAEAVQLFNRFATYNGSNPYKAPGMLSLIPHLEMNEGVFYPKGGMINITNALYNLARKKEVRFYFNAPVEKIIHDAGKVKGIVVNNTIKDAEMVISNVDVYFTYKKLLADDMRAQQILKQERSSSAFIFYWGINKIFSQLQLHNIFFSSDYKKEFESIFIQKKLFADPTVYINITSKIESQQAPAGKENWFVMINVPAGYGQISDEEKNAVRNIVAAKLSRILKEDITAQIVTEQTLSPFMIEEQSASYMGSLYGTSSNSKLAAFLRHPNFKNSVKGLYFCGGSVHPGGGIPLCLKSAKIVCNIIAEDFK